MFCSAQKKNSSHHGMYKIKETRGCIEIRRRGGRVTRRKGGGMSRPGGWGRTLISPVSSARLLSCSCHPFAASVDNFLRRGALSLLTTHRSSELILLLWQRAGDLGHAVMPPPPSSCSHLKSCQHPPLLLLHHHLTLTFPGDFPQRCVRACVPVRPRICL